MNNDFLNSQGFFFPKEYMNNEELILFAMYLTGHNKETIEQMYRDWLKNKVWCDE